MLFIDSTLSPEEAAELNNPIVVVTEVSATVTTASDFQLLSFINGTNRHQSVLNSGSESLLSAAEILEASMELGIDEDHELYAEDILRESRHQTHAVKL